MEVAFFLCDAAQVSPDGKVHILGAGWRLCGPVVGAHAVVAIITFEPSEQGVEHALVLDLVDEDGHVVTVESGQGPMTIRAQGSLRVDPLAGSEEHVGDAAFVAPVPAGLPLIPGSTYVWQLWLDGNTREDWRCTFYVRPAPA